MTILATVPTDATTPVGSFSRDILAVAFAFALVPLRLTTFGVLGSFALALLSRASCYPSARLQVSWLSVVRSRPPYVAPLGTLPHVKRSIADGSGALRWYVCHDAKTTAIVNYFFALRLILRHLSLIFQRLSPGSAS